MHMIPFAISLAAVSLLSGQAVRSNYDVKKEVIVHGAIISIKQHPSGPNMVSVIIKNEKFESEIVVAPEKILEKHHYAMHVGDVVTAFCAPENSYFKARKVTIAGKVLEILHADGSPVDSPDGGRKSTRNSYDTSKELRIVGTIKDVKKMSIGAGYITNILVFDGASLKEIFLGPDFIFGKSPFPMAPGDRVEIVCAPEKTGYRARQLRIGHRTLVILDEHGRPIHASEGGKPLESPSQAGFEGRPRP